MPLTLSQPRLAENGRFRHFDTAAFVGTCESRCPVDQIDIVFGRDGQEVGRQGGGARWCRRVPRRHGFRRRPCRNSGSSRGSSPMTVRRRSPPWRCQEYVSFSSILFPEPGWIGCLQDGRSAARQRRTVRMTDIPEVVNEGVDRPSKRLRSRRSASWQTCLDRSSLAAR